MSREETLKLLREHKAALAERFGVTALSLFGSVARDEVAEGSDVDILISFDGPTDWRRFFGAQFYLEDVLGRPVDLVTEKSLRPEIKPYVQREAVRV